MVQRALITGVSGFAGGHLAEFLLARGDHVLGTSPSGQWEAFSSPLVQDDVTLVPWDMSCAKIPRATALAVEEFAPHAIYHLAAVSVPAQCGDRRITRLAEQVNVEGTRQVLRLAGRLPSRPRVLFVSSSHVYQRRETARGFDGNPPEDVYFREDAPVVPATPYGMTKWKAEEAVRRALRDEAADVVVVRAFQHTGPRQQEPLMLPQWIRQFVARDDGPVEVHTKDAWIDVSDVRDVVRAYALVMEHGRRGEIYNVGSGVNRRTGDLLEILLRLAGPDREIVEVRPGFKQDPVADVSKLSGVTGWSPRIDVERTIADTLSAWSPLR